jgi:hypothetical protein
VTCRQVRSLTCNSARCLSSTSPCSAKAAAARPSWSPPSTTRHHATPRWRRSRHGGRVGQARARDPAAPGKKATRPRAGRHIAAATTETGTSVRKFKSRSAVATIDAVCWRSVTGCDVASARTSPSASPSRIDGTAVRSRATRSASSSDPSGHNVPPRSSRTARSMNEIIVGHTGVRASTDRERAASPPERHVTFPAIWDMCCGRHSTGCYTGSRCHPRLVRVIGCNPSWA